MTEDAECAVCHQPIPKGRIHYGGVSCYSCRAFFRRNTQRELLPICKGEGRCRITYMDRKQCSSCRYTQCLSTGMRPELVLNEEEKKRRFKKLLKKKEEEASNVTYSPELQYSDSLYERAHTMTPLEPSETNQMSSIELPRVSPFPYTFPPSASSLYRQSISHPAHPVPFQQWNRQAAKETKNFIRHNEDFSSELKSEVNNYVEKEQYEHTTSQACTSLTPQYHPTSSQVLSIPSTARFQVKPHPIPWMPSPPSSPEERIPMAFSHHMKDAQAWLYFASKGFLARKVFPESIMRSPSSLRTYLVAPDSTELYMAPGPRHEKLIATDLSRNIFEPRPSVITNHSYNHTRSVSPCEEDNSDKIKLEKLDDDCETKSEEEYDEKDLETTPVSSVKVYLPLNLSIKKDKMKNEPTHKNDDLIFKYVHKKFRTQVDNSEKNSFSETFPQKRKSVILHASATKKICTES